MHPLIYLLMILAVIALAFMLLRRVFLWYWRIPERIELMKEQNSLQKNILGKLVFIANLTETSNTAITGKRLKDNSK